MTPSNDVNERLWRGWWVMSRPFPHAGATVVNDPSEMVMALADAKSYSSGPSVANMHTWTERGQWVNLCAGSLMVPQLRDGDGKCTDLDEYRRWLWLKLRERDRAVLADLRMIEDGTTIVCCCKPAPCHGDVVLVAWRWAKGHGVI